MQTSMQIEAKKEQISKANRSRIFIDDVTGKEFRYMPVRFYTDGSYHVNITRGKGINTVDDAKEAASIVQEYLNIRISSINEGHFR